MARRHALARSISHRFLALLLMTTSVVAINGVNPVSANAVDLNDAYAHTTVSVANGTGEALVQAIDTGNPDRMRIEPATIGVNWVQNGVDPYAPTALSEVYQIGAAGWSFKLAVANNGRSTLWSDWDGSYTQCEVRDRTGTVRFSAGDGRHWPAPVQSPYLCTTKQTGDARDRHSDIVLTTNASTPNVHTLVLSSPEANRVLNSCAQLGEQSCRFANTRDTVMSRREAASAFLVNCNPLGSEGKELADTMSVTDTVSQSNNLELSATASTKIFGIVEVGLNIKYSASWTSGTSTTLSRILYAYPGHRDQLYLNHVERHVAGNFDLAIGNDVWRVSDAEIVIPAVPTTDDLSDSASLTTPADCAPRSSTVTITTNSALPPVGQPMTMTAQVSAQDDAGRLTSSDGEDLDATVSFTMAGQVVPNCQAVPVSSQGTATCIAARPSPSATVGVAARYSGNRDFAPSTTLVDVSNIDQSPAGAVRSVQRVSADSARGQELLSGDCLPSTCTIHVSSVNTSYSPFGPIISSVPSSSTCFTGGLAGGSQTWVDTTSTSQTLSVFLSASADLGFAKLSSSVGYGHNWTIGRTYTHSLVWFASVGYQVSPQQSHLVNTVRASLSRMVDGQLWTVDGITQSIPALNVTDQPQTIERLQAQPVNPAFCDGYETTTGPIEIHSDDPPPTLQYGRAVTLQTTVTRADGLPVTAGTMDFTADGHTLCASVPATAQGQFSCPHVLLPASGQIGLAAHYAGHVGEDRTSTTHASATSRTVAVSKATPEVTIRPLDGHLDVESDESLVVDVVSGRGASRGLVSITEGTNLICLRALDDHGSAYCPYRSGEARPHRFSVHYAGDSNVQGADETDVLLTVRGWANLVFDSAPTSVPGVPFTLQARVNGGVGSQSATGDIVFTEAGQTLCTARVTSTPPGTDGSLARCNYSFPTEGVHDIAISYSGDDYTQPARAAGAVVAARAATAVSIASTPVTSAPGSPSTDTVDLTVTVRHSAETSATLNATLAGTMVILENGRQVCAGPLVAGLPATLKCRFTFISGGRHNLTARFAGDTSNEPSDRSLAVDTITTFADHDDPLIGHADCASGLIRWKVSNSSTLMGDATITPSIALDGVPPGSFVLRQEMATLATTAAKPGETQSLSLHLAWFFAGSIMRRDTAPITVTMPSKCLTELVGGLAVRSPGERIQGHVALGGLAPGTSLSVTLKVVDADGGACDAVTDNGVVDTFGRFNDLSRPLTTCRGLKSILVIEPVDYGPLVYRVGRAYLDVGPSAGITIPILTNPVWGI